MSHTAAKHAEIKRRYRRKGKTSASFASLRVRDLNRLFHARYGHELPDDDAGKDDVLLMAHHLASLTGDPRHRITGWIREHASWLSVKDHEAILTAAIIKPQRWKADKLAWRLRLTEQDRATLGITTIGAVDFSKAQRTKRRKEQARIRKAEQRREQGKLTRAEYLERAKQHEMQWKAAGISRRTWYRRKRGTSPSAP